MESEADFVPDRATKMPRWVRRALHAIRFFSGTAPDHPPPKLRDQIMPENFSSNLRSMIGRHDTRSVFVDLAPIFRDYGLVSIGRAVRDRRMVRAILLRFSVDWLCLDLSCKWWRWGRETVGWCAPIVWLSS